MGELTWAIIALVGLAFLIQDRNVRLAIGLFGGALLFFLAFHAFKDARNAGIPDSDSKVDGNGLLAGVLISLGNPFQIAFWLGIGGSAIATIMPSPDTQAYVIFMVGYMLGTVLWSLSYSALVAYGRKYLSKRLFQTIYVICGLVLVYFAITILWSAFTAQ